MGVHTGAPELRERRMAGRVWAPLRTRLASWPVPVARGRSGRGPHPALRRTQRLLAHAEPEDGDAARPRGADRLQVDPGEARGREADAVAEQHRQYVHQDLVDKAALQALGG